MIQKIFKTERIIDTQKKLKYWWREFVFWFSLVGGNFEVDLDAPVVGGEGLGARNLFDSDESEVSRIDLGGVRAAKVDAIEAGPRFETARKLKKNHKKLNRLKNLNECFKINIFFHKLTYSKTYKWTFLCWTKSQSLPSENPL